MVEAEFAHLLTKAAGESSLVKVPSWLDEGVAVSAQKSATEYTSAFNASLRTTKDILPFDRMSNYPSDPKQTIVWYGQSYTMTQFLVQKYGAAKMAQYFAAMKKGTRADLALQQVYGFDQKGFEDGFRAAVLGTGTQPTATPRQQQQQRTTPAATAASRPSTKTSSGGGSDFDKTSLAIIGGSFVFALLAVMSFLVAMMLQNSRGERQRALAAGPATSAPNTPDNGDDEAPGDPRD